LNPSPQKPRKRKVGKFEYDDPGIRRNSKERIIDEKRKIRSPVENATLKKLVEKQSYNYGKQVRRE